MISHNAVSLSSDTLSPINHYNLFIMKQIKVVFIKVQRMLPNQNTPVYLAEQKFNVETENFIIPVPSMYQIMSVTEILPDVTITKDN